MPKKTSLTGGPQRPDPEKLLKLAEAEEPSSLGRLKIFLGYSAGVGKTYAMLEAARRLKKEGVDVVVGYIEAHKRAETQALVEGLEVLPRAKVPYRNAVLEEMDLDAVMARRPAIALVDELAHTNIPGSRHAKRYQDIEELLLQGISVYTTLNIQHLESLNDVVAKVTGVSMHETVPDKILDEAGEIEVVDISISELIKRLREGRVYLPEAAERAMENFFTEGNLAALRELTLRRAAKRVNVQSQDYFQKSISGKFAVGERLVVCVSPYASSVELVRAGRLLAAGLDAEWHVVYVETPGQTKLPLRKQTRLSQTLKLAEELEAKVATLTGRNVAEEVIVYARRHQATKILIGKPFRRTLKDIVSGTVVDQLIRRSGEIDVYVINRSRREEKPSAEGRTGKVSWTAYLNGFFLVAAASMCGLLTRTFFAPANLVMYYLLAVTVAAIFLGRGASVFVAMISVVAFDFLFVPPFFTFAVSDVEYLLTFFVLFIVGLLISTLTARVREQAESARARESYTASLYGLSRDLARVREVSEVALSLIKHGREILGLELAVFIKDNDHLRLETKGREFPLNDRENAVADWVFKNGQPAGRSTETLPAAAGFYMPLQTSQRIYGVLGVLLNENEDPRSRLERRDLLESFAGQAAAAIERILLSEEAQKTRLLEEREKLQSALFNSISHDLRTPLVSITGALSGMLENPGMDAPSKRELLETANEEAGRLNRLVGNLLDMARLESSALKVTPDLCEVRDVVGAALKELEGRLEDRKVTAIIPEGLPHVPMDFGLMMKVLVNLIDNAVKYAPFGLPIDIEATQKGDRIEIRVLDRGLGIPKEDMERIFDKFYRVNRPLNVEGSGLGLSICKGIVEAHHGRIWAEERPGGGTVFAVSLPVSA